MADPLELRGELDEALGLALGEARRYLESLDEGLVREPEGDEVAAAIGGELAEEGDGALAAIRELVSYSPAAVRTAGPRFFHFVIGGGTPAALAADWYASALDQPPGVWVASPLGARLEQVALAWLRDLFGLPGDWGGVLTTGATMANFTALAAARHWAGERHGVDVGRAGVAAMPTLPILTSGYFHVSAVKAVTMAGLGSDNVHRLAEDPAGRLDLAALERELARLGGAPAIIWANAGDVDSGDFDPIEAMADLAAEHGAWLHVDGAFGLFARAAPALAPLAAGVERAQSVISDGHKWLNVPYDCGFAFVRDERYLAGAFGANAPYIPEATASMPNFAFLGPEMSRRARSFAVWATLRAYGRSGYRNMVERHCTLARRVAAQIEQSEHLELLAPARLNVICFRSHPAGLDDEGELDRLNRELGAAVVADGRILFGTTTYAGKVAFRPAISNWRTTQADADLIAAVTTELLAELLAQRNELAPRRRTPTNR
jgi:glutamate/tyrosine decarboxylase-like PLP-dependent enzyme